MVSHNDQRRVVGHGPAAFSAVSEALLRFGLHRRTFPRVDVLVGRAQPGATIVSHAGPFAIPCRVTSVIEEENRRGFAYRALPGNPVAGEEQFTVTLLGDGDVELRLLSDSRPAGLPGLVPPLVRAAQAIGNRRYFAVARRYARAVS